MNTNEKLLVIVKHALENNDAIRLMEQKIRRAKERKEAKAILDSHINKLSTE